MSLWWRLDLRLALAVLLGLLASGAGLVAWQSHASQTAADADWQAQSLGLANYVVQRHGERLAAGVAARQADTLAEIAMYITMINPALEAYLLAADGSVVAHTLPAPGPARWRIDLAPAHSLIRPESTGALALPGRLPSGLPARLPIYGEDPRLPTGRNLISVAPAGAGWLYLVLRGEQATQVAKDHAGAARQAAWVAVVMGALGLGGATTLVLQRTVTRRVRRLALELAAFRPAPSHQPQRRLPGDEIDQLCQDARALKRRVQQQVRQLEDSDRQRRELITNISHDLHTPLANIRGWLDTLLISGDRLSPAERQRHLKTAVRHCAGLGRRVSELFELANLDSARAVAHPEPFCMAELVSDVIQAHQLVAEQREVSLNLADDADTQISVDADIGLIERVLNNLVDNALRHTARGGRVSLTVLGHGEQVLVRVADNGQGIAPADLPHVFERYWTTRSATSGGGSETGGVCGDRPAVTSGLGLAIARRIIELHGGTISVRSAERQGCEFTFSLPVRLAAA